MSGTFTARGDIDPSDGRIITCLGKKRSGKSKMALLLFDSWPGDRLVIDVNGDDGPVAGAQNLEGDVESLPTRWPEHLREDKAPMLLRFTPDPGSPTFLEDMDAALGIAWRRGDVCVLVHEMGLLAPANRTPPNCRRVLQSNRHRRLTLIACAPRPVTMDPLVLQQSDLVFMFTMPNPDDRKRVADNIGWDPRELDREIHGLRPHEYLRFDANESAPDDPSTQDDMRLIHFDPLPADVVAQIDRDRPGQGGKKR